MALPTLVCIQSVYNNKYLRYRHEDVQTRGLLQFSAEKVMDPYAQFEVVKAKSGDGLVHLKSRYTNKYLVRWSPNHYWITASANEPNEDQKSWTCTLFKPSCINCDPKKIRLQHVQLGHYACLWRIDAPFDSCLYAGSANPDKDSCDVFNIIDWESVFKMPRSVTFKGDNGKYLGAFLDKGKQYLQFSYDSPNDPKAKHEILAYPDGSVCVKSVHFGKFWRLGDGDYILADADDPRSSNKAVAMFRPAVLDLNKVALLNMGQTRFCKRYTMGSMVSFLSANTTEPDRFAALEVISVGK